MNKPIKRVSLVIGGLTLIWLLVWNGAIVQAQWPPFTLRLTPSHEGGRITYSITQLRSEVDWLISDIRVQIPLPPGLRFVEAVADAPVQAGFDGQEVFFFFLSLDPPVEEAYFVVEVSDPKQTVFTLQPWLSWEGKSPGSYSPEPITVDISQPSQHLNWQGPVRPALQLQLSATTAGEILTYKIYPQKMRRGRIWDLKINLPIPEGLTFLSAEAPPGFEITVDPKEVRFFTLELPFVEEETVEIEPLTVHLSTAGINSQVLTTRAWASWKNATRQAGVSQEAEGQTVTGDIVVQPQVSHYTVTDGIGDVPFADYDLTGVSLQNDETLLQVGFYTAGPLCGASQPLEFRLFLDMDCQAETGQPRNGLGAEYEILYDLGDDQALIRAGGSEGWRRVEATLDRFVGRQAVLIQAPHSVLTAAGSPPITSSTTVVPASGAGIESIGQFCWAAQSRNRNETFVPALPADWLPNSADMRLAQYQPLTSSLTSLTSLTGTQTTAAPWAACLLPGGQSASVTPGVVTEPAGRVAVPLYSSSEGYTIRLFSVTEAREVAYIINARQPHFRADGQRLLFRRPEDNGGIYEYNFSDRTGKLVTERLNHQHPFYDPWANRLVYGNQDLILGADGNPHPFLLVQCSLLPPSMESEQRCQDILGFGVLLPAGQMGEIQGSHPVWTATDLIAYAGCNSWAGFNRCGLYTVPSLSTKGFSNGFTPVQLTDQPTDTPSDTKGNFIAFSSQRDGNWEAYLVNLDGSGLLNLSNSAEAQDGLPAISPDGQWVAFVSNRGGGWAIWATSIDGRQTRKLFDLPTGQQIGKDEADWLNDRLAWGP